MDFAKKYGALDDGIWVDFDDAKIKFLKPNTRKAAVELLNTMTAEDMLFLQEVYPNVEKLDDEQKEEASKAAEDKLKQSTMGKMIGLKAKMAAQHIVDWKNIAMGDTEVPYSKDKAVELCVAYPEFLTWVEAQVKSLQEVASTDTASKAKVVKKK